jgi:ankyrin repeat protein
MPENNKMLEVLIDAVIANEVEIVNKILNQGFDPNQALDAARVTPLHFAAQNGSLEVIPLLVEAGADICACTQPDGQTPLDVALLHKHESVAQILLAYLSETDRHKQ